MVRDFLIAPASLHDPEREPTKSGKRVEQCQSKCAGRVSAKPQSHFHPIPVIYARNLRP